MYSEREGGMGRKMVSSVRTDQIKVYRCCSANTSFYVRVHRYDYMKYSLLLKTYGECDTFFI